MILAELAFTYADQMRFAAYSRDYNPMHVDVIKARRTQAGAPVVHGINLLLWALNSLATARPNMPKLRSLRVRFLTLVYLNEPAKVVITQESATGMRLNISVDDVARAKVTLEFGESGAVAPQWVASIQNEIAISSEALELSFEQMQRASGNIPFRSMPNESEDLYPAATKWLNGNRISALAATTYLVGMICPGLHSIYTELSVKACTELETQKSLTFRVSETDPIFHSVEQEIAGGGWVGTTQGFARTPPVQQPSMVSLSGSVDPAEFAGSTVLVVGGSRGLGELTAKLLAVGGARVLITWQSGQSDAEKVAAEIRAAGGECETLPYDARKPAVDQLANIGHIITHAYYFATPAIFQPQASMFVPERLDSFQSVYVVGFWQLAQALRSHQSGISLFYPSSIAVSERPRGMTEYTMAKAAGEILCADMNTSLAPMHITVHRLPRLPTDQTASVTPAEAADPLQTMLPLIKEVQAWPK